MLGQFLEISVATDNIGESYDFYQRLGFQSLTVGEILSHQYAVMTDGNLVLGLHALEFSSPALTYVRPNIASVVSEFEQQGITFLFTEIRDDVFNEAHFTSPEGLLIRLFEARTFSPPAAKYPVTSLCGHFAELRLLSRDLDKSVDFWESSGFVCLEREESPDTEASLTSDGLNIGLRDPRTVKQPVLVFQDPDMPGRMEAIRDKGIKLKPAKGNPDIHELLTPEGIRMCLMNEEDV